MLWFLASVALAVPLNLQHSGRLLDSAGVPLTGAHTLDIALYDAETGGTLVWSEQQPVDFDEGYFAVHLGDDITNNLAGDDFDVGDLWIGVTIDGGTELPRKRVVSVPYAIRADTAVNVDGGVVNASAIQIDGTTVIDSTGTFVGDGGLDALGCSFGQVPLFDGSAWGCTDQGGAINWDAINDKPLDFADDVDDDTLAALPCTDGQIPRWSAVSSAWACDADADTDTTLDEAAVDGFVANNGYLTSELDPAFTASAAATIDAGMITNWTDAHGWGDHGVEGYLTGESDPAWTSFQGAGGTIAGNLTVTDSAGSVLIRATDPNGGIEIVGDGGTPYLDFVNDATTDFDARFRLTDDDTLALEGAQLAMDGMTGTNIAWMIQHGAASAACAAASPQNDSPWGHIVIPHEGGKACSTSCAETVNYTNCRTSIAVGSILRERATSYGQTIATNYNYQCGDTQNAYDEIQNQGVASGYTAYCCCYR